MENVKFFGLKDYFYNKAVFGAQRKKKMKEKKYFEKKLPLMIIKSKKLRILMDNDEITTESCMCVTLLGKSPISPEGKY